MGWKTIYITGRQGFDEDVLKHLERSSIDFMPGYNTGEERDSYHMYWIHESLSVSDFKRAIGAKTIWRYRLNFFLELEEFMGRSHSVDFTDEERQRIARMRLNDAA